MLTAHWEFHSNCLKVPTEFSGPVKWVVMRVKKMNLFVKRLFEKVSSPGLVLQKITIQLLLSILKWQ